MERFATFWEPRTADAAIPAPKLTIEETDILRMIFTPLPFTWYSGDLLRRINHPKNLNSRLLPPGVYG